MSEETSTFEDSRPVIPPPALVNGEPADCLSLTDRGLLYGDGVFETLAVHDGSLHYWSRHMTRLAAGCRRLGMQPPEAGLLRDEALRLAGVTGRGVLKIIATRGSGGRGYRAPAYAKPTRVLQLHPWPDYPQEAAARGIRVHLCSLRLGHNPALAGIKHLNRLEQVLARQEWDDPGILEGLLQDQAGRLIEGTMSNLFLVRKGRLITPDLHECGVAGILRSVILELAEQQGLPAEIRTVTAEELPQADEVFLCNSLIGIWPVTAAGTHSYPSGALTRQLQMRLAGQVMSGSGWRE